ncbi:MAG TPA: GGDEF domain-containing protein [Candidatus Acidoferrales bacterium]|nr:GGDEF domain-containing protein [Candidatus Acidoferrales bacterium]
MPQPSESHAPSSPDDSLFDLLVEALDNMEENVRAAFLQQFFKSMARIDLTYAQSLDYWTQILARRKELSELVRKRVSLKTAIVDVLASTAFLRVPILMEYEEFKKLQLNAATDALTGLYNRRLFEEYCDKEFNRAKRYGHQLALVLLDLHSLKELNDRYGHLQGDQALQLAATTLRKNLRASDFAFRIGGDEFALLLPQADPEQAAVLCDRLRTHFEGEISPLKLEVPVTIDYGIAVYPHDGDTKEMLTRIADQRLYGMKNAARARPSPPQQPPSEESAAPRTETRPQERTAAGSPVPQKPISESAAGAARKAGPEVVPPPEAKARSERRKWERVSLAGTRAYAALAGDEKKTATVIDLCTGGLSLLVENAEELASSFVAVLHVPILPPLRVTLRKVYTRKDDGSTRVGCAFAS